MKKSVLKIQKICAKNSKNLCKKYKKSALKKISVKNSKKSVLKIQKICVKIFQC